MRRPRVLGCCAVFLVWICHSLQADTGVFVITPAEPEAGKAFQVSLKTEDSVSKIAWSVNAFKGTVPQDTQSAGIPGDGVLLAGESIEIKNAVAELKYVFRVSYERNMEEQNEQLIIEFPEQGKPTITVPSAVARTPPTAAAGQPSGLTPIVPTAPPSVPMPVLPPEESVQVQLQYAQKWSEEIAKFQKTDDLIISVEFFREAFDRPRDYLREDNFPLRSTLRRKMDRPLLDAARFFVATRNVEADQPADADSATLQLAWAAEKERFLIALVEENAEAKSTAKLWRVFLDEWQAEANRVAPDRFRDALLEGPLVVTAILLGYEKEHILAAMTGGAARTSTSISGRSIPAPAAMTHGSVHHARAMSRIRMRHERQMARLGY